MKHVFIFVETAIYTMKVSVWNKVCNMKNGVRKVRNGVL